MCVAQPVVDIAIFEKYNTNIEYKITQLRNWSGMELLFSLRSHECIRYCPISVKFGRINVIHLLSDKADANRRNSPKSLQNYQTLRQRRGWRHLAC
jgi:hypothetical protein